MEPKALSLPGKCSTTELNLQTWNMRFWSRECLSRRISVFPLQNWTRFLRKHPWFSLGWCVLHLFICWCLTLTLQGEDSSVSVTTSPVLCPDGGSGDQKNNAWKSIKSCQATKVCQNPKPLYLVLWLHHQTPFREKPVSSSLETHWSEHRVSMVPSFSCSICSVSWGVLQIELTARKTQSHFNSWLCWVWGLPGKESPIVCLLKDNLKVNLLLSIFLYK